MNLNIHTNNGIINIKTKANITIESIMEQLEQGNLVYIETISNSVMIINCININAIEIIQ